MTANLLTVNSSKTEFIFIGDWQDRQLHTYYHQLCSQPWLQVSAISKACYYHIRQRRCIRPYLDPTTTCNVSTYIVFSKLDYCNSLYYNLHTSQITDLQQLGTFLPALLLKLLYPLISRRPCALSTGSK